MVNILKNKLHFWNQRKICYLVGGGSYQIRPQRKSRFFVWCPLIQATFVVKGWPCDEGIPSWALCNTAGLDPSRNTQKINCRKTARATTIPRPPSESFWRGESKSALTIFVKFFFDLFFRNKFPNIVQRKIVKKESDSPRRILVCRGLISFWGALVRPAIDSLKEVKLICVPSIISCSRVPVINYYKTSFFWFFWKVVFNELVLGYRPDRPTGIGRPRARRVTNRVTKRPR